MANRYRGTIYVGVTSALWSRACDHKDGTTPGLPSGNGVTTLAWCEHRQTMEAPIRREKQIRNWLRAWKIRLIEEMPPPQRRGPHDEIGALATRVEA